MADYVGAVTTTLLGMALDAADLRQQAISANIANANSIDYVPVRVSFEEQFDRYSNASSVVGFENTESMLAVRPKLEPLFSSSGLPAKVLLDVEVSNLSQNAVHYQALAKGLSKFYGILSIATSDGKK